MEVFNVKLVKKLIKRVNYIGLKNTVVYFFFREY